jgi:hypothetical protein
MKGTQDRPAFGKNGLSLSAEIAGRLSGSSAVLARARQHRRSPLFAQFPPAALFKAIGRAVARRAVGRQVASGTVVAMCGVGRPAHNRRGTPAHNKTGAP